ncbi:hypothetical protein [Streptomyces sp. NPDC020742]|uniref:hypothetical protein n=1 Tax=Streptomyces sp. NPDC020742 TaxID=3154897 RepID=UPI0033C5B77F
MKAYNKRTARKTQASLVAALALAGSIGVSAPAGAAPRTTVAKAVGAEKAAAARSCDHVTARDKSNGVVVVVASSGYTKAYKEPGSNCMATASMAPGRNLNAWCFTINSSGNQWVRVNEGWIYTGHLALKSGTVKHC